MNGAYGIRIPAAFESEQRWYDINAYGGRKLAGWSWLVFREKKLHKPSDRQTSTRRLPFS
jgi:hypothetical protein